MEIHCEIFKYSWTISLKTNLLGFHCEDDFAGASVKRHLANWSWKTTFPRCVTSEVILRPNIDFWRQFLNKKGTLIIIQKRNQEVEMMRIQVRLKIGKVLLKIDLICKIR